jgi:hypothetical protein
MRNVSAVDLEASPISEALPTTFVDDAREFLTGFLLTIAVAAAGTVIVTLGLLLAVVAAPLALPAAVVLVARHRRGLAPLPAAG